MGRNTYFFLNHHPHSSFLLVYFCNLFVYKISSLPFLPSHLPYSPPCCPSNSWPPFIHWLLLHVHMCLSIHTWFQILPGGYILLQMFFRLTVWNWTVCLLLLLRAVFKKDFLSLLRSSAKESLFQHLYDRCTPKVFCVVWLQSAKC